MILLPWDGIFSHADTTVIMRSECHLWRVAKCTFIPSKDMSEAAGLRNAWTWAPLVCCRHTMTLLCVPRQELECGGARRKGGYVAKIGGQNLHFRRERTSVYRVDKSNCHSTRLMQSWSSWFQFLYIKLNRPDTKKVRSDSLGPLNILSHK